MYVGIFSRQCHIWGMCCDLVLLLKFLGTGTTELDRTNTEPDLHPRPKTSNKKVVSLGMRVLVSYSCLWQHITQKKRGETVNVVVVGTLISVCFRATAWLKTQAQRLDCRTATQVLMKLDAVF